MIYSGNSSAPRNSCHNRRARGAAPGVPICTEVRGREILRTSPVGRSPKLGYMAFPEVPC